MSDKGKKPRGLAALTPEQRAEISRKGGKAAHAKGTAHQFSSEEAKKAGSKGGKKTAESKRIDKEVRDSLRDSLDAARAAGAVVREATAEKPTQRTLFDDEGV